MKKALLIFFLALGLIMLVRVTGPVKTGKTRQASGMISTVYLSAQKELLCKIKGLKTTFRLNPMPHLNFETLKDNLIGQNVEILYADDWTPLDPAGKKDIAELRVNETLVYSESLP